MIEKTKYHYIVMSQKEMFKNQVIEEVIRERASHYLAKSKVKDFWLVTAPSFLKRIKLETSDFYHQTKQTDQNFYSVLISSNKEFLTWIKLRLGYFEPIGPTTRISGFAIDGVCGEIDLSSELSPLRGDRNLIDPQIFLENYKKITQIYCGS